MKKYITEVVILLTLVSGVTMVMDTSLPIQPESVQKVSGSSGSFGSDISLANTGSGRESLTDLVSVSFHLGANVADAELLPGDTLSGVEYHDQVMTNGGKFSSNENFGFDSRNKEVGGSNLETEKVMTYQSTEGAHLEGEEFLQLDTAGNWDTNVSALRCVLMANDGHVLPAFCNKVTAKSTLTSVNSARISSKGSIRSVAGNANVPAALSYQIAVAPDSDQSKSAEGTVRTYMSAGIAEARDNGASTWNKTAAVDVWTDASAVIGGIKDFEKSFIYNSGFQI